MASVVYNNAKKLIGDGTIDWDNGSHTYRILLVNASYTPNIDTDIYVSAVTNELVGSGYVRKDIATRTITVDTSNDRADYKGDNVTWTAINAGTAAACVLFKFVTVDGDSPLIAYIDFTDTVTNGGDFTLKWDGAVANGRLFSVA